MPDLEFKPISNLSTSHKFVVIITRHKEQWVFVRHQERLTWELPAGHVENNETVLAAAKRELYEETGAIEYEIRALSDFSGTYKSQKVTGRIFYAEVKKFSDIPESEIAEKKFFPAIPESLTYPDIQNKMIEFYLNL